MVVVVVVYSTFLRFKILLFTLHYAAVVSYLYNMASGVPFYLIIIYEDYRDE